MQTVAINFACLTNSAGPATSTLHTCKNKYYISSSVACSQFGTIEEEFTETICLHLNAYLLCTYVHTLMLIR